MWCHSSIRRTSTFLLTCVASVTDASCRYSELPHPYSCPSVDTARLQSPYVLICCTSTPARSPATSTGLELMLWCPRPARQCNAHKSAVVTNKDRASLHPTVLINYTAFQILMTVYTKCLLLSMVQLVFIVPLTILHFTAFTTLTSSLNLDLRILLYSPWFKTHEEKLALNFKIQMDSHFSENRKTTISDHVCV